MARRTLDGDGRVARRLAQFFAAQGYTVLAFYPALGVFRTDGGQDCYRGGTPLKKPRCRKRGELTDDDRLKTWRE